MDTKLQVFVLFTEDSIETISDCGENFHWHFLKSPTMGWGELTQMGNMISTMDNDSLQKLGKVNAAVGAKQFMEMISCLNNFHCDKCGKDFGDVEKWGTDRLLALDGLSGLSRASKSLAIGWKPILSQPDWGVCMNVVEQLVYKLAHSLFCHLVLISHIEPEKDEVTGAIKNFPSTLGRKLGPSLPQHFKDVVLATRIGQDFRWNVVAQGTDTKARILPLSDKISPDFAAYLKLWESHGGEYISAPLPGKPSGIKMLLEGPPGTGKTYSLRTLTGVSIPAPKAP